MKMNTEQLFKLGSLHHILYVDGCAEIVVLSTKKNHCLNRVRGKDSKNQRLSTVEATSQHE